MQPCKSIQIKNYFCGKLTAIIINIVNSLYLFINKINGYIEESNGNIYLMLVPSDESKETLKNMKNYGTKSEMLLDQ